MDDARNDTQPQDNPAAPAPAQSAIRGAFLARAGQGEETAPSGAPDASGAATLRSAFLKHLAPARAGKVVGDEGGGDRVLRSAFAARSAPAAAEAPVRRARPAPAKRKAAAKKKRPARSAAKPMRPAKRAVKKRAAATASRRAKAKPVARPRRKARTRTRR
jgi:RNA polymerase-binding transcription factor